ncbi:uncharacterized protein, partial [Centruroides vittatus]|uniref:uncharacterized protein n=1 Tax=Centruroides vittatus TaxID=120091 RepID=UPI00350EED28
FKAAVERYSTRENFQIVINPDKRPAGKHKGRFNAPSADEVALVILGQSFEKRDILIQSSDNNLVRIPKTHRSYDALQYSLLFCYGEDGYCVNIPQVDPVSKLPVTKTVSASDFYAYRIMVRENSQNRILYYKKLFNQFLVDMYAKIETERLGYIRRNQTRLRVETYAHLKDAISKADAEVSELGKMTILPATFHAGDRYMHERTQDGLAYVRHYGKPDLFITFTCNPKWSKIKGNLLFGQEAQDRNDLIARVFHLKQKKFMQLMTKCAIFGKCKSYMSTIEQQKRGLPHSHNLFFLEESVNPNDIDMIVSAEIPDPEKDPELYEIVKAHMIHGPCGSFNRNSPCMKDGFCSKGFPKPFSKETQYGFDGFPKYRRRSAEDGGFTVTLKNNVLDNRWVVPYSPVLMKSIKYITKYINKGSDQAAFAVENKYDEITKYEVGRYISSSHAAWRILGFPIHEHFPPVMHLAVHLENGQRVYFTEKYSSKQN